MSNVLRFSRTHSNVFELDLRALKDECWEVREEACGLLAYSLRREAIPNLQKLLSDPKDRVKKSAQAAIDAIENQNPHYFFDREHCDNIYWVAELSELK